MFALMKEIGNTSQAEPTQKPATSQYRKQENPVSKIDLLMAEAKTFMDEKRELHNKY